MAPKRTRKPKGDVRVAARLKRPRVTIDILSEDVLIEIFDFYVDPTREYDGEYDGLEAWCTLVHVCRKWRNIVLESPVRLNLRIRCYPTTPVRKRLDVLPALPIVLAQYDGYWEPKWGVANVTAALEQNNRICQISLWGTPSWQMEDVLAEMHKSFPILTHLNLESEKEIDERLVDPDWFLGGSAPCLRVLQLAHIPFPGLPKLLLSTTHLTDLRLSNVSYSGYISPEEMVSCLSGLTMLETVILEFEYFTSFPLPEDEFPPPPPTCTPSLLPALTRLEFDGVSVYSEDLVVRIDAPLLDNLKISLHDFIPNSAQLAQLINRTPKLTALNEAHVVFDNYTVYLTLRPLFENGPGISPAFSATVESLYICDNYERWPRSVGENNHWLGFLRPFTSVKSLYLSRANVQRIAPALQELVGESVAGVLPALQTIFLEDLNLSEPVQEAIGSFVSGRRQFSSHPVAVSQWNKGQADGSVQARGRARLGSRSQFYIPLYIQNFPEMREIYND